MYGEASVPKKESSLKKLLFLKKLRKHRVRQQKAVSR